MTRNVDADAPEDVLAEIIQDQINAATLPNGENVDVLWHTFLATVPTPRGISAELWTARDTRGRWVLLLETLKHSVQHTPADVCFEILLCDWAGKPEHWEQSCPAHTFADVAAVLLDPDYVQNLRALNVEAREITGDLDLGNSE